MLRTFSIDDAEAYIVQADPFGAVDEPPVRQAAP